MRELKSKLRRNMPADVRVAVPYYKPGRNQTSLTPDFNLHETAVWLKYPHSLEGLTRDEIATHPAKPAPALPTDPVRPASPGD
jgi:hypothetical protein